MVTLLFFLTLFFLFWIYILASTAHCTSTLGESLFLESFCSSKKGYFLFPLSYFFNKRGRFAVYVFNLWFTCNLGRLAYFFTSAFLIYNLYLDLDLSSSIALGITLYLLLALVGDFLPRFISSRMPRRTLRYLLGIATLLLYLALPLTWIILIFANFFHGRELTIEDEEDLLETQKEILQLLVNAGIDERLDPLDLKLIESVIKFKSRIVREVMIPRVDLFTLPAEISIRTATRQIIDEGYSRIPVYRENIDNITGLLMFKDVLELYRSVLEGEKEKSILDAPLESITKSVFYVPETKQVSYLLQEFRAKQMHMAIVVDEYGGTEGVVTMEDILEEIVGEIADEYDHDEEILFSPLPAGGGWTVDARMSLIDTEESLGILIPKEGDYDTIGGYVFHNAGEIPPKGYMIHHQDYDLEILSSTDRSIEKVRITLRHHGDTPASDSTS